MPVSKTLPLTAVCLLACAALLPSGAAEPPGGSTPRNSPWMEQVDVFVSETEGYNTFRIPALLVTPKGTVLAVSEGRKKTSADDGDVDLVCRRSTDGGKTWGPLKLIHEEGGDAPITIGNPCLVAERETGVLLLLFCRNNKDVFITRSRDDGRTWSRPQEITKQVKLPDWTWYATGPGAGIQLERGPRRGRLVIPCDHRLQGDKIGSFSHIIYSDDRGKTWKLGGSAEYGTNESQVVERADGTLLLSMRRAETHDGSNRAIATSPDAGMTWSKVTYDEVLFMPRCQVGFIRYAGPDAGGKPMVMCSSPVHPRARWRMTVRLSEDDGRTWSVERVLHPGRAAYSAMGVLPDGTILCQFEAGVEHYRERQRIARFNLAWLRGGGPPSRGEVRQ